MRLALTDTGCVVRDLIRVEVAGIVAEQPLPNVDRERVRVDLGVACDDDLREHSVKVSGEQHRELPRERVGRAVLLCGALRFKGSCDRQVLGDPPCKANAVAVRDGGHLQVPSTTQPSATLSCPLTNGDCGMANMAHFAFNWAACIASSWRSHPTIANSRVATSRARLIAAAYTSPPPAAGAI